MPTDTASPQQLGPELATKIRFFDLSRATMSGNMYVLGSGHKKLATAPEVPRAAGLEI